MSHTNGKSHGSLNGRSNGTHEKAIPLPSNNRIAKLLEAAFRPTETEEACLKEIAKIWQSYRHRGLEIRHMMGKLLNEQIGSPDDRQDRGKGIMALASERLSLSNSELNRMRWTAHLFTSVKVMQQQHPDIDSWTRLKEKLPGLMPKGRKKKSPAIGSAARFVKNVSHSIRNLTSVIKKSRVTVKPSEQDDLLQQFSDLAELIEAKLQIRVTVTLPRGKLVN